MRRKWSDEFLSVGPWEIKRQQEDAQYEHDIAPSLVCVGICQLPLTAEQEWLAIEHLYHVVTDKRAALERAEKRRGG